MPVKNPPCPTVPNLLLVRGKINDQTLLNCTIGRLPLWGVSYAEDLVRTLTSLQKPFPCTFAVAAAKKNHLRFGFIDNLHETDTWWPLTNILSDYLKNYQKISRDTSLVIFFPPGYKLLTIAEYYQKFWDILQFLHDNDPEEWPASVPRQVDDKWWEFSFGGVPIFAVCSTPAHGRRKSRSSPTFLITFQPRWVFEGLGADTPRGTTARRVIRERLRAYDYVQPSPELGAYGNDENREWRQYFLPDDNQDSLPECPFRHR
jgi:FPC/CPF motif-containing protein YcgG